MATKTVTTKTDDLDQSTESVDTVAFSIDGQDYEIDLSGSNAAALREVLAPYVAAGRAVKKTRKASTGSGVDPKAVRAWAKENNIVVADRGRIHLDIINQFKTATGQA